MVFQKHLFVIFYHNRDLNFLWPADTEILAPGEWRLQTERGKAPSAEAMAADYAHTLTPEPFPACHTLQNTA